MTDNCRREIINLMFLYSFNRISFVEAGDKINGLPVDDDFKEILLDVFSEIDGDSKGYVDVFKMINSDLSIEQIKSK